MDYSQLAQDPDHPEGTSPWNTSPRHSARPSLSAGGEQSPSPLPNSPYAKTGLEDSGHGGFGAEERHEHGASTQTATLGLQPDAPKSTGNSGEGQVDTKLQARQTQSQQEPRNPPQARQPAPNRLPRPQHKLQAKITGLERTGRKDPILRFDVHTNLPKFRTTQFRDVRRTHSEFIKLAEHLISSNPEAFVPAVPLAVTSAGAGTDEDEARVKGSMQRWLNYVCSNEVLMRDDEMVLFVESDFGYSPVVRMKQPATGVKRKMIKQLAPPPDDTPELFEARPIVKRFYLGTMDTGQKVDKVVRSRRGNFSTKLVLICLIPA